jgi:transposase InsO family protein
VFVINEDNLKRCPRVKLTIGDREVISLLDSGADSAIMSTELFEYLMKDGLKFLQIPIVNCVLVTAFGNKSKKIRSQALIEFKIDQTHYELAVILAPNMATDFILGMNFMIDYKVQINFPERIFKTSQGSISSIHKFYDVEQLTSGGSTESEDQNLAVTRVGSRFASQEDERPKGKLGCELVSRNVEMTSEVAEKSSSGELDPALTCDETSSRQMQQETGREYPVFTALSTRSQCRREWQINQSEPETRYPIRDFELPQRPACYYGKTDERSVTPQQLRDKVDRAENISLSQKEELFDLLMRYKEQFSSKPGKFNLFTYRFVVEAADVITGYGRTIPFGMREEVRTQIEQLLADGIIEPSNSSFLNPLTVVARVGKSPRICLDARKINKYMLPDRTRTPPIQELLQRFHGSKYISSIDLSSAFLQVMLDEDSRKYTAFLFDSQVYQYTRTPYGFRNSGAAFIRALNQALGSDTQGFALSYVDDVTIHSKTFELHMVHLQTVIDKLTRAGFTINAGKCNFCRREISFLGHVISDGGVSPDPRRIDAILSHPRPKNQKQLRQFLGVCNYHHRFIINYAKYTAPLLPLLKKESRWKWTEAKQEAFEVLRSKFAESIHLIHPDESRPYMINTDASGRAIGAVLMQVNSGGETQIVSTASRVLNPAEQRYTVAEQELLGITFALEKFRLYIYGHKIHLNTDNKALTFLNRCTLTSNRIARWVLQIQEYDLEIKHISGVENHLADVISRNPGGLNETEIKALTQPREIMIATIDLGIDTSVNRKLRRLASFQENDPRIQSIIQATLQTPNQANDNYLVRNNVLYHRGKKRYLYWRAVLPTELESDIIKYVHESLGHQGTEKCVDQIAHSFSVKNLGRKVRKFVARCDTCQKMKHPTRRYAVEWRSHLPTGPGQICATDIFGPLPIGRAGVRYILIIVDVFTKYVKLYALKKATTKACLSKVTGHFVPEVIRPEKILSDNGSNYASPLWRRRLAEFGIEAVFSPIRHPSSNPSERYLKEVGKFCRIYCQQNHRKWPELLNQMEDWINGTVSSSTGYTATELMFGKPKPDLFEGILKKKADQLPKEETREEKAINAYARIKLKAAKRNEKRTKGKAVWNPQIGDLVLVKRQAVSEGSTGTIAKFVQIYTEPMVVTKQVSPSAYEISERSGKLRGKFNKEALKPYLQADEQ